MTVGYHEIAVASLSKIPGTEATKQESWHFKGGFCAFSATGTEATKQESWHFKGGFCAFSATGNGSDETGILAF